MGQSVSNSLSSCQKVEDEHATELAPDVSEFTPAPIVVEEPPKLGLRIFSDPCVESDGGALCAPFLSLGSEIIATEFEKIKGWDALRARYERSAKERAGVLYTQGPTATQNNAQSKLQWPEGYRFNAPRRFWRAKVTILDGQGGYQEHPVMMVVANAPEDRTQANIELDLEDSKDVASYCSRYNKQLQKLFAEADEVPAVRVCGAVGCEVIKSSGAQFVNPGEAVTIMPYPFPEVRKFLFDGSEDFMEVPQAFFHHAAWLSNGREFVCDLQGIEDEESNLVVLVDPCVLRAARPTVGSLLSTLAGAAAEKENVPEQTGDVSSDRFDALHPRCSQLCKAFDPHRRSACRRHCGLNISCGV